MASRLLLSLESLARSSTSATDVCLANAKMAGYYARRGNLNEAKSLLAETRSQPRNSLTAPVLSFLNLAEGLVEFKSGHTGKGSEKWVRAKAIALAADYDEGLALASAWLAFAAYLSEDIEAMAAHVRSGLAARLTDYPQALARISLTLGLSLHYCGESDRARANYAICHRAATDCGDEVEVSALMHDTAAMSIHSRRNAQFGQVFGIEGAIEASGKLGSALNYEELVGISSLPSLSPILVAQEEILRGHWSEAIDLINNNIQTSVADGYSRLIPGLLADRALCRAMVGQLTEAQVDAEASVERAQAAQLHRDDVAALYSRLGQVFGLVGNGVKAAEYSGRAANAWEQVNEFRSRLRLVALQLDSEMPLATNGVK